MVSWGLEKEFKSKKQKNYENFRQQDFFFRNKSFEWAVLDLAANKWFQFQIPTDQNFWQFLLENELSGVIKEIKSEKCCIFGKFPNYDDFPESVSFGRSFAP